MKNTLYDSDGMVKYCPTIYNKQIYKECCEAMLRLWMDHVISDAEYYRIMGRLNKHIKNLAGDE